MLPRLSNIGSGHILIPAAVFGRRAGAKEHNAMEQIVGRDMQCAPLRSAAVATSIRLDIANLRRLANAAS